jgi:hypothetical protein
VQSLKGLDMNQERFSKVGYGASFLRYCAWYSLLAFLEAKRTTGFHG